MLWHLLLLVFGLQHNFSLPTASMQPTLMIGEVVQLPVTHYYLIGPRSFTPDPHPGDIIVFNNRPTGESYIKRVVAVAGDRVQMSEGRLVINGRMTDRRLLGRFLDRDSSGVQVPVDRYQESLANGATYQINEVSDEQALDNTAEYVVPTGRVFVLGDNRDRSLDSRVLKQVGYVPIHSIEAITGADAPLYLWRDLP